MWLPIHINEQSAEPLYYQIEVQLRALIVSGQLEEGLLLPSIREFAQRLKCSIITIRRVYQDLEAEGLLRTKQGTGTYVAKVENKDKDRYRLEAVIEAFNTAIEAGLRVQCSKEELYEIFQKALQRYQFN
ncbi:GntR family transcriptional regulator [Paenibacillus protaetiae]|uniref:GntR family transcriptional regulator n=1 Tax=Paenibacillus protaetiae TaxID=2509456 RepID=A0A4P6F0D6_9BACL|nr:GntR family transcriptional regulator [Paenibacillus protaetiae]QAY68053.1 GntR family transcriptional regulator [Paenibacillus protaetiae]